MLLNNGIEALITIYLRAKQISLRKNESPLLKSFQKKDRSSLERENSTTIRGPIKYHLMSSQAGLRKRSVVSIRGQWDTESFQEGEIAATSKMMVWENSRVRKFVSLITGLTYFIIRCTGTMRKALRCNLRRC